MDMSSDRLIFPTPGVMVRPNDEDNGLVPIRWAMATGEGNLKVKTASGKVEAISADHLTQSHSNDRIVFESDGDRNFIREIQESDGTWLSKYKVALPVEVLERRVLDGKGNMAESIKAYALDDSPYVIGVVYQTSTGNWLRQHQDWTLLSPDDETFSKENIQILDIDPEQAREFIELYDKNYVTVSDAEKYESAESDEE
jgi:hypothetical protein